MTASSASDVGQRLLHVTIDKIAAETPDRIWASIPKSNNLSDGYQDVSFASFAAAINRLSWCLKSNLGPDLGGFRTVAYIGTWSLSPIRAPPENPRCRRWLIKDLFSNR